jgi:alpha-amylase/alpha-mannosidase (GH57 family)
MERYLCVHCHFYQPPRENPWLEAVELQDSASPYHDWNERVAAECYLPNGAARILDEAGRIAKIVNNYARISFNFGPTLLSWMERNAPHAYERVLQADRQSQQSFSGHGAALAQAYNHMILPLANARDKATQIVWGMSDFLHRFGRDPEGMWLPETAVDLETLELLSSVGLKFTILAQRQARRMRHQPWEEWFNLDGAGIDPARAYACHLPSGRTISLFFYDGPISHAVAFEKLLLNGQNFANRLLTGFNDGRQWPQLVHIATDGETYGHHHTHGDMALAYALDYIERNQLAKLTNYGEYLAKHPPSHEVEIVENSSWSCVHGVKRWESDCGCNSGGCGSWRQHWRQPLRQAMDWLRDDLATLYELNAKELLRDPWAARDDYISVVLDRSPANVDAFLARHAVRDLSLDQQVRALRLLEVQRHLMLMYTSCGWFFDELTGPETVHVLQYAGRAVQLSEQLFGEYREEEFLRRLEAASSNIPDHGNGRRVYERFVRPAMLDLLGVGAHYAISSLFDGYHGWNSTYSCDVDVQEARVLESGQTKLALGRARIVSNVTRARLSVGFAVLYFGDHNLSAGVRPFQSKHAFRTLVEEASLAFSSADLPECLRVIDRHFRGATYSLKSLFRDEQRRILSQIVNSTMREAEAMYRQVYEHHAPLMRFLSELHMPPPPILRTTAEFVLGSAVRRALTDPGLDLDRIRMLLHAAQHDGVKLEMSCLESALRQRLNAEVERWARNPGDPEALEMVEALVSLSRVPPIEVDLWKSQNVYYQMVEALSRATQTRVSSDWLDHFRGLGEWLGVTVPQRSPELPCTPPVESRDRMLPN